MFWSFVYSSKYNLSFTIVKGKFKLSDLLEKGVIDWTSFKARKYNTH